MAAALGPDDGQPEPVHDSGGLVWKVGEVTPGQADMTRPPPPVEGQRWAASSSARSSTDARWIIASMALVPLAFLLLVDGLATPSLALVYLSIFCSVVWLPLLAFGVFRVLAARRNDVA